MSCTRAISKMFSNALTTSNSALLIWWPYTWQNVSHEVGNEPHKHKPLPILCLCFLFVHHSHYHPVTNHVGS
jgi:hypothetical protein